ncbi:Hypothetical predicted protein [Pelobates cultripes]|uniref:Uncharacterized protein n=1 Tax=Pelobates cultripes TaxID=61616 RepID=A0AAD1SND5_PELCU|nr:Hypothetical predicted protein [Pelobates cultripes]
MEREKYKPTQKKDYLDSSHQYLPRNYKKNTEQQLNKPNLPMVISMEEEDAHITQTFLQECLNSQLLQITLEISKISEKLQIDIQEIKEKVNVIELNMEVIPKKQQSTKETTTNLTDKIEKLEAKVSNMDNRSRRSNRMIRNIPETRQHKNN